MTDIMQSASVTKSHASCVCLWEVCENYVVDGKSTFRLTIVLTRTQANDWWLDISMFNSKKCYKRLHIVFSFHSSNQVICHYVAWVGDTCFSSLAYILRLVTSRVNSSRSEWTRLHETHCGHQSDWRVFLPLCASSVQSNGNQTNTSRLTGLSRLPIQLLLTTCLIVSVQYEAVANRAVQQSEITNVIITTSSGHLDSVRDFQEYICVFVSTIISVYRVVQFNF